MKPRFLFLQGMASPLFTRLGDWLLARGVEVFRINFCAGDALYWRRKPAWHYRGALRELPEFLRQRCARHAITDLVMFCDQFPVHRAALAFAAREGLRAHVFEEGYVRPHWVTLQRGATHAAYLLPREAEWYLDVNARLPDPGEGQPLNASIAARAARRLGNPGGKALNPPGFPR